MILNRKPNLLEFHNHGCMSMVYSAGAIKIVLKKFLLYYLVINGGKINDQNLWVAVFV